MRSKLIVVAGIAVAGGVALLAGSQPWVSFMLDGEHALHSATGHDVNPALSPVAIALVAAALALTIAGKVFRAVLGALVALLGAGVVALCFGVINAPLASVSGKITELTGIAGGATVNGVVWSQLSGWAWATLAAGLVAALLGVAVLVVGRLWAQGGRKYDQAPRDAASTARTGKPDRISDWDSLSDGEDPTSDDDGEAPER
ncbi:Trp biosynthesis-associated membrane protein [Leucobacter luti]|uniref:Trp biosynthesis-associated membrane protein n=1 Tax=Leucobacter luti TaxID=340320 RepID=UPI003D035118